jgi:LPS-assembly protein
LSERASLSNAEFVMYEQQLYGIAESVTRDANGTLEIEDGQLTFCAPTDPSWLVTAETLNIDPNTNTGEAWGARIDIKGVPVAYLPWVQFPLNDRRKTGLLFPDISSDTRGGLDVTVPIYMNLAPNYDATYSPRLIQDRGLVHQLNTRFLGRQTGFWDVSGTYLRDDDLDVSGGGNNRWLVNVYNQAIHRPSCARPSTSQRLAIMNTFETLKTTPSARRGKRHFCKGREWTGLQIIGFLVWRLSNFRVLLKTWPTIISDYLRSAQSGGATLNWVRSNRS